MQVAIVGAGRIGTTLGYYLAKAGHEVTLIARNQRLAALQREQAIVTVDNDRVAIKAAATLDAQTPWELVIVTVLAHQVDAVLPQLAQSQAKKILFAFNIFDALDRLRSAVGEQRFVAGFPMMTAFFVDGKLKSQVNGPGMVVTTSSQEVCEMLKKAGLPTAFEPDMESYLRSHAAFVIPMMMAGHLAFTRQGGISWHESMQLSEAMREAFGVVKQLGNKVTPGFVVALSRLPRVLVASVLWSSSRTKGIRDLGSFGPGEVRALMDAMIAKAPDTTKTLQAVRPE